MPRRGRSPRRGGGLRGARHSDPLPRLLEGVLGRGVPPFPRRIRRRPHAQPGRAVQPRDQVQVFPRRGAGTGGGCHRHRPLRPRRPRRTRFPPAARGGPEQGPELLPAPAGPGPAGGHPFPAGWPAQERDPPDRRGTRPAHGREKGFHRHLLHRRARFPQLPGAVPAGARRRDAYARRQPHRQPPRRVLFHPGPARRPEHRRRARPPAGAVVRGRQGRGAQHPVRRPGPRQPVAAVARIAQRSRALDRRQSSGGALCLHRADPLPAAGRGLRGRSPGRRHGCRALRPPPARGHPRSIGGALRWRPLPGRRGDRRHRRTLPQPDSSETISA